MMLANVKSSNPIAIVDRSAAVNSDSKRVSWLLMPDITHPKLIYAKGFLFLFTGLCRGASAAGIPNPTHRPASDHRHLVILSLLLFRIYVIQYYVDPGYRFAGSARLHISSRQRSSEIAQG